MVLIHFELIKKYGADALRMGLLSGTAIGNDVKFDENKVKGIKHFANKIWNISRFVLENSEGVNFDKKVSFTKVDETLLERLNEIVAEVTSEYEDYRLHIAAEKMYQYIWTEIADKIIEESKPILNGTDEKIKLSRQHALYTILTTSLRILHPCMPFVTEEIWSLLPTSKGSMLMVEQWPHA